MNLPSALENGPPLLMDGAMGSRLRGLACAEMANLVHPDRVQQIHREYADVGARVHLTNTFQANPIALARYGLEEKLEEISYTAVRLARQVTRGCFVIGSVGPIISPGSSREFADRAALMRTVNALEDVDAILFETCSSPDALSAIEYAFHRVPAAVNIPLFLSLTYHIVEGRIVTFSGHAPEVFARHAEKHGVAALGVNCGKEIDTPELTEVLRRYAQETSLPLFVRGNAGTPDEKGMYPRTPQRLASAARTWVTVGTRMIGGCCGTTAAHIEALAKVGPFWRNGPG